MTPIVTMVLATGTDMGKTYVSCALLRQAVALGRTVRALKPVMSGFSPAEAADSDAGQLAAACGEPVTADTIGRMCVCALKEPLAPNVAARRAGVELDYKTVVSFVRAGVAAGAGFTLIEGAGGVLSPLTDTHLNADLAADLGLPVVLVTANYLGAVSHTLSAIEACEKRGVAIAAIALTQPSLAFETPSSLAEELRRWTSCPQALFPFAPLPQNAGDDAAGEAGAATLFGLLTDHASGARSCTS